MQMTSQTGFTHDDRVEYRLYALSPDGTRIPISFFTGGECSAVTLMTEICAGRNLSVRFELQKTIRDCLKANDWKTFNLSYYEGLFTRLSNAFARRCDQWLDVRPLPRLQS